MSPAPGHANGLSAVQGSRPKVSRLLRDLWGDDRLVDPVSVQGQHARGLYFNGPMQRRLGAAGVIRAVKNANMNAVVLDFKDGQGRVMWDSQIEELQPQKRLFVNLPEFIGKLKQAGIYTIGRIVCFSDPQLPRNHPDRAVMDARENREGQIWASWGKRNPWLDPHNKRNHDLIVEMTREAQATGLDEVQLDYIRFPVDDSTRFAKFPARVDMRPRREVLLELLKRIDEAITIPLGADVFGLTAFRKGDPAGLGQSLEDWTRYVEVFSPMLYINGMTQWVRDDGEGRAGRLMHAAVKNLRRRLGHGPVIRPFMQAFSAGADYYNAQFIAEQVRGARTGGADGFLFWHPASNYGTVRAGMLGPARTLVPFDLDARYAWRRQSWGDRMSSTARADYYDRAPKRSYLR
jgi:hypothetical protein